MTGFFIVDLQGFEISEAENEIVLNPKVGGIILFSRNFKSIDQLKTLVQQLHKLRPDIFVAVDQEGGWVQRFKTGFRFLPTARTYGDVYNLDPKTAERFAFQSGQTMAQELLDCEVDLSMAPVLDLHGPSSIIGKYERAFHSDPNVVSKLALSFISGMNQAGMPAVGKHFPGHGLTQLDSHVDNPINDTTETQLRQTDLLPFINLIKQKALAAVMPAHVTYSGVDRNNTAGYSKKWLQEILRDELKFDGLVISDCLSMKGADIGDLSWRSCKALQAGCNMLIVCNQDILTLNNLLNSNIEADKQTIALIETFKTKLKRFQSQTPLKEKSSLNVS